LTIFPLKDFEGAIVGASKIVRDVTEIKLAEAKIRDAMERIRGVVDQTVDGIITINASIVETVNTAVARNFHYSPEVVGQNVSMLMPKPFHREHDGYLARYLHTREARIIGIGREVRGRRKDGSEFPQDLTVSESSWPPDASSLGSSATSPNSNVPRNRCGRAKSTSETWSSRPQMPSSFTPSMGPGNPSKRYWTRGNGSPG
jgi:PAS domain S-box-containing protein